MNGKEWDYVTDEVLSELISFVETLEPITDGISPCSGMDFLEALKENFDNGNFFARLGYTPKEGTVIIVLKHFDNYLKDMYERQMLVTEGSEDEFDGDDVEAMRDTLLQDIEFLRDGGPSALASAIG